MSKKNSALRLKKTSSNSYVKWLRLKASKEYREASLEIRRLQECVREAEERFSAAREAYLPYLHSEVSDSPQSRVARQEYWTAEDAVTRAQCELTPKEDEICKKFGLFQWWDPTDDSITIENADFLFSDSPLVEVLEPTRDKRVDLHIAARRALDREGVWLEPLPWKAKLDKDGCLTLKVNLNASLEEVERAIAKLLRFYRPDPPKTRRRPDKVAEALKTWDCYERTKRFSEVAQLLKRPVSTVKGQYMRACLLIHGQRPTGSIKQRRAGVIKDPAIWFQSHLGSCSRCQKTNTAEGMCAQARAFVNQDTKIELDTRASLELAKYGSRGKRTPQSPIDMK